MQGLLCIAFPVGLTALAAYLFWRGLRNPQSIVWEALLGGFVPLAVVCLMLGDMARSGYLGGPIAFYLGLFAFGTALVAAVVLAVLLPGKRKLFPIPIAILFPAALWISIQVGDTFSPESLRQRDGDLIVAALNQYRADHGTYPSTLDALVPDYVTDLQEPTTVWGWLYSATDDGFSLGFVAHVDWAGYSIYLFDSRTQEWDYLLPWEQPFDLPPTPSRY